LRCESSSCACGDYADCTYHCLCSDEDELEEKIEELNKSGLAAISRATGLQRQERQVKLKECREYLRKLLAESARNEAGEETGIESNADLVDKYLDKFNRRIYGYDVAPSVDALDYLEQDSYSDEEVERPQEDAQEQERGDLVYLSDSDAEIEEDMEKEGNAPAVVAAMMAAPISSPIPALPVPMPMPVQASSLPSKRALLFDASRIPKPSRSLLLISLRQKVQQTAKENYCEQRHIQNSAELSRQLEISEKCRQLVELLKERFEERSLEERQARRAKFQELADADEEEFDAELAEGQFLTEEERRVLLAQLQAESEAAEEQSEEEDVYAGDDEQMDEGEEGGGEAVMEELKANKALAEQEIRAPDRKRPLLSTTSDSQEKGKEQEGGETQQSMQGDEDEDDDDEEECLQLSRKVKRGIPAAAAAGSEDEASTVAEQQSQPHVSMARDARQLQAEEEQLASEAEDVATDETVSKEKEKRQRMRTGNAMYRLQLEEEERRLRQKKGTGLVEDEAEEEEEEGHQAGLGDFGFGVSSRNKEMDEEREALKLRKGDLDHIVDELSSDEEEDNAEAQRARALLDEQQDKERTKMIITAVTEGHDRIKQMKQKGYSFETLVQGRNRRNKEQAEGEEAGAEEAEEEWDEEEMMQRGMEGKLERTRLQRQMRAGYDSDDISDTDSDSAGGSDHEDMHHLLGTSGICSVAF
jgi:hypothetical protein